MLRIIQNNSPAGAKSYYSQADYYSEGQELQGTWRGHAAERLGLAGEVRREQWEALCDNRHPITGERLTPRLKEPRRVGYDINFHAPKSLSVLYGLTHDDRLLETFRAAVGATMRQMEAEMKTRVRRRGVNEDRVTGNMAWGEFIHFTARPVDGVPDPHLHAHCFTFNVTWDNEEARWKAGQFADLKRDAPYFEAVFHSNLARGLADLGIAVERTRTGWEIAGIPRATIARFSRRTALIEDAAREKGIDDPRAKGELGAKTREKKTKSLSMDELRQEWRSRLSADEAAAFRSVQRSIGKEPIPEQERDAADAVNWAIAHCFERSAVLPERKLLATALKRGIGAASADSVTRQLAGQSLMRRERAGRVHVTTPDVLAEEQRLLAFARSGRGTCRPFASPDHQFERDWLNQDQRRAVLHVLTSRDRVVLVRGAAGTGKTTMMQEAVAGIEVSGQRVLTLAPSAAASRGVLRKDGFADADTVALFLTDEKLQAKAQGGVVWVDEAGLLGSKTTAQLFDIAHRINARVILSGDRRQHGSVERGCVLRLLEDEAGLAPAELKEIQRQSAEYKAAVRALSEGKIELGFKQLDDLGWIRELGDRERYKVLAESYVESIRLPGETLVVCPTHSEAGRITREIRSTLKAEGRLKQTERTLTGLRPMNLTEAERSDASSYLPGDVLVFHQNARGHPKGTQIVVGNTPLPLNQAARFTAFRPAPLEVAAGDRVRITRNGTAMDGHTRLNNGDLFTVKGFTLRGDLKLDSGAVVSRDFGHLDYGYVVTSYASQGRSVERVIIGQASDSFPASSTKQWYVSVSRGKKKALILTDDKKALLEAVSRDNERISAVELVAGRNVQPALAMIPVRTLLHEHGRHTTPHRTHAEPERREHERY